MVDVVEHINRWKGIVRRKDLFGAFDLLAVDIHGDVLAVQVTSRCNVAKRVKKIADIPTIDRLRNAGWNLEVWGYGKTKTKGDWLIVDIS